MAFLHIIFFVRIFSNAILSPRPQLSFLKVGSLLFIMVGFLFKRGCPICGWCVTVDRKSYKPKYTIQQPLENKSHLKLLLKMYSLMPASCFCHCTSTKHPKCKTDCMNINWRNLRQYYWYPTIFNHHRFPCPNLLYKFHVTYLQEIISNDITNYYVFLYMQPKFLAICFQLFFNYF